ncbi:MAG TPA: FAD-binding oxidoreductase, partial [Thermomicrobiales bacterium]|nr:FAD-binding oxidoreductase [Thermomicrobiales bacterium]
AAGAWSDDIAATISLRLPIRTMVLQMLLSTPGPLVLKPVIGAVSRQLSLKQLPGGEFFLGGGWPGDPAEDRLTYTMRDESVRSGWDAAVGLLPAVSEQRIARQWCGLEAECFDGVPLIGPAPGFDGLTLAVGFSGHGFALCPAVGRAVADQLAGLPTLELDMLDPSRMASFDPDAVERFISAPPSERLLAG